MKGIASDELPAKCQKCAKPVLSMIDGKCNFCQDLEFDEAVLCHLNRCIQDSPDIRCHAFQPILKLAGKSGNEMPDLSGGPRERLQREFPQSLLHSDKIKYEKALALQKLARDPDGVFIELKYHFAWNVIHRRPVFSSAKDTLDFIHDTFFRCSELAGGFVSLLWLATDHVHLFVESDGERSVETLIQEIKRYTNDAILTKLVDIKKKLDPEKEIWDVAYFCETVG